MLHGAGRQERHDCCTHARDVERAAKIAVAASFSNTGQLCISMERIYIHTDVFDEFVSAFVRRTNALNLQAGIGWGADVGSPISAKQLVRVAEHVDDAVAQGARVLSGGKARPNARNLLRAHHPRPCHPRHHPEFHRDLRALW